MSGKEGKRAKKENYSKKRGVRVSIGGISDQGKKGRRRRGS